MWGQYWTSSYTCISSDDLQGKKERLRTGFFFTILDTTTKTHRKGGAHYILTRTSQHLEIYSSVCGLNQPKPYILNALYFSPDRSHFKQKWKTASSFNYIEQITSMIFLGWDLSFFFFFFFGALASQYNFCALEKKIFQSHHSFVSSSSSISINYPISSCWLLRPAPLVLLFLKKIFLSFVVLTKKYRISTNALLFYLYRNQLDRTHLRSEHINLSVIIFRKG